MVYNANTMLIHSYNPSTDLRASIHGISDLNRIIPRSIDITLLENSTRELCKTSMMGVFSIFLSAVLIIIWSNGT